MRIIVFFAAALFFCANSCNAENFVIVSEVGNVGSLNVAVDRDSIGRDGGRIFYKIRYFRIYNSTVQEEFVVADCSARKRGVRFQNEGIANVQLYSTYPDTANVKELIFACATPVGDGAQAPSQAPTPAPAPTFRPKPVLPKAIFSQVTGSGFVVANGYVVTNEHVINDCQKLNVVRGLERVSASVVASSQRNDLALIKADRLKAVRTPGIRTTALLGEEVTVSGYPLSGVLAIDMIVTSGQINALAGLANDPTFMQISAPIQSGNSGGPVIDRQGNIVGVVVSKLNVSKAEKFTGDQSQNVNFAIKPEILRLFLDSVGIAYRLGGSGRKLDSVEIAQSARSFTVKLECIQKQDAAD